MTYIFATAFFCLLVTAIAARTSMKFLSISNLIHMLAVPVLGATTIHVFGLTSNLGNIFYAAVTFGISLKTLKYGADSAQQCITNILIALSIFFTLTFFSHLLGGNEELFLNGTRIVAGAFIAFYFVQTVLIFLVAKYVNEKNVIFTLPVLTIFVQLLDSVLFFPIAFGGVIPINELMAFAFSGWVIKSLLAIASVPLIRFAVNSNHNLAYN